MTTATTETAIEVGSILYSSWGYDQTNITFYEVLRKTAKTVTLQPVHSEIVESGDMVGKVIATKEPKGKPVRRSLRFGNAVRIESYEWAYVWDGQPKRFSAYA